MAGNENGSSISFSFSQDTDKQKEESAMSPESSLEEGAPPPSPNKMSNSLKQRALSDVSKQYSVNGDGKLDEAEQAMRNLDTEGRGYLTNDKVLTVFQNQLKMQKQLLLAKRLVIFFAILLVILAVANIGVVCPGMSYSHDADASTYTYVLMYGGVGRIADNKIIQMDCHADPCTVTGNGLLQTVHEPCVYDSDCESSNCVVPSDGQTGVCKLPLGAACGSDGDCEFNYCQPSQAFGAPGSCTCNPASDTATISGCNAGETCYSANEQLLATNIVGVRLRCLLPVGATCTDTFECLTNACLSIDGSGTNTECVCSSSNYPCAQGEACVNGTCQVSTGSQTTCPQVPQASFCFEVLKPVKCGDCCYSNSCRAAAAAATDLSFDSTFCATPADGECPEGSFI